ncbi:MAG: flagellar motor switch protein FliG [Microbacteriaceae bacterium]
MTSRPLSGVQKAALVITQLDQSRAVEVLRRLSETEAEEIATEIVRLRRIDPEVVQATLSDFLTRMTSSGPGAQGGREAAEDLMTATFGSERATSMLDRLASNMAGRAFEFLDQAEAAEVANLLDGELPETIALVLAHLQPLGAARLLAQLDDEVRTAVAQSIASMGSATPEAVAIVAETLRHRARAVVIPREQLEVVGGVQPLVEIINRADVATERALLEQLDERDPELAEEVRSRMLTFDDLVRLESRDVQRVLRGIDPAQLAVAMKGAGAELIETITSNMTERNRESLAEEIGLLGPVRKTQLDEARAGVVRAIRELEASGDISLHRAEEDELVV